MAHFAYQAIKRLPKQLEGGILYHSEDFEVAALACACGCGHRVMLMVPDSHQVTSENGLATVRPSISVCDAPCKSHFFIIFGKVEWLPAFSDAMASLTMRAQIAHHVMRDTQPRSWMSWIRAMIAPAYGKLKSLLGMWGGR